MAECWLEAGQPRRALDLLLAREQSATSRRIDEGATRAAALATVRILRRQRLRERYGLLSSLSLSMDTEVRAEAMAAGALIAGLRPPRGAAAANDHAAWRARILLDPRSEEVALAAMRKSDTRGTGGETSLPLALNRLEAEMVARRWTRRGRRRVARAARDARRARPPVGEVPLSEPLGQERLRLLLRRNALLEEPTPHVETLGDRRKRLLGRLALEEAEVLALRLPERATVLFAFAEGLMEMTNDRAGAFIASLRGAIADIHADRPDAARAASHRIFARYRALREEVPQLPPEQALPRGPREQTDPGGDPWCEWTYRLELYRRWCDAEPAQRSSESFEFEPETTLVPAVGAGGLEVRASVQRNRSTAHAASILSLVVAGVGVLGGLRGDSVIRGLEAAGWVVLGGAVGAVLGSLAAFVLLKARELFRTGFAGFELALVVVPGAGERALDVEARLEPWTRSRWGRLLLRFGRLLPPQQRWNARLPLDEETIKRPLPATLALAVSRTPRQEPAPIRLAVTARLAGLAWERWLLAEAAQREDLSPEELPPVWRVRSRGLLALRPDLWPPRMSILASARWKPYVESSAIKNSFAPGRSHSPSRATIVLGLPALTRAGWRLRLDEEPAPDPLEESEREPAQELVSPDRVAHEAPIAIVIGRPGGGAGSEHWFADGLRAFANETFLAGARAVITVPSLSAGRASEAILHLTGEISSWTSPPDRERLLELAARLRAVVGEPAANSSEERRVHYAQALDVCLFAPR